MAAENYLDRFRDDFELSEQEVIARINQTLDEKNDRPSYVAFPYTPSRMISSAPQTRAKPQEPEISEEKMAEYKKIWAAYPRVEQPEDLSIRLFPHQLVTVHNMEELERVRKVNYLHNQVLLTDFGILSDIPGYGKSYSVVTLLLRDKMRWDVDESYEKSNIHTVNNCLKIASKTSYRRVKANLLLASPTLIAQWKEYFSYIKNNKVKVKEVSSRKDLEDFNVNDWDVVIVNTTRYNELIDLVGTNVVWKRFIFDEAGSTHVNSMRHVMAGFTWFVTATPETLLYCAGNYSHYMKGFFASMDQTVLKHLTIKNPILFVKHSFKMPAVIEKRHVCYNPRVLNVLSHYIDSEARVMISAGDIKGAIARLGGGSANDTNLFEIVSRRIREKLSQAKFSLDFWKTRPNSQKDVEAWEKKVKELEKTLKELEEKYKNVLEEDCTICYAPIDGPVLTPCCQNVFCGKCIMKWLETSRNTCPMCRSTISKASELVYINKGDEKEDDEKKEDRTQKKPKQKQETVLDIVRAGLEETPKKKFLIFSMYDESFSIIRRELDDNKIDFVEISGSKATRDSKIKKFKEDKVNVVFLNSRFNGAGINLEMATDIILYHEMPDAIREQVVGRALRIGRDTDLTIHNLVYENNG